MSRSGYCGRQLAQMSAVIVFVSVALSLTMRVDAAPVTTHINFGNQSCLDSRSPTPSLLRRETRSRATSPESVDYEYAINYLTRFGYIQNRHDGHSLTSKSSVDNGLKKFQKFANIEQTGNLTDDTKKWLFKKRCAMSDTPDQEPRRKKRYVLAGSKRIEQSISYHIGSYPKSMRGQKKVVDEIFVKAFEMWSNVTNLEFFPRQKATIKINFVVGNHEDGESFAFDGPGNTIAHASHPIDGGTIHFDDEEDWTTNLLLYAAVHEIGHTLGLEHSRDREAVMFFSLDIAPDDLVLPQDDVAGIRKLYGDKEKNKNSSTGTYLSNMTASEALAKMCQSPKIDAISWTDGVTYLFRGHYLWELDLENLPSDKEPVRIGDSWPGAPSDIDAALYNYPSGLIFFKGDSVWRYGKDRKLLNGDPRKISDIYRGVPSNIDAVTYWGRDQSFYFFKGNQYWRYNSSKVLPGHPKTLKDWKGLPSDGIDEANWIQNDTTLFFKGDQVYYFDDVKSETTDQVPLRNWFNCA